MSQFPITAYDRPGIALANLLKGDPRAAALGLFDPEALAPEKVTPLHKRFMGNLNQMAGTNPLLRGIMSVATDPLVILSLFLSSRFPYVGARKMFEYGRKFAGYKHVPGFLEGWFMRAERLFAGTQVPPLMLEAGNRLDKFHRTWGAKVSKWFEEFRTKTGRYPNYKEHLKLGAKLAGMDEARGLPEVGIPMLAKKIQLSAPLQSIHDHMAQEWFPGIYKQVVKPMSQTKAGQKAIRRVLARAGIDVSKLGKVIRFGPRAGYWPHTLKRSPDMLIEYAAQAWEKARGDPKTVQQLMNAAQRGSTSMHVMPRFGLLTPAIDELKAIGDLNPRAVAKMSEIVGKQATAATARIVKSTAGIVGRRGVEPYQVIETLKGAFTKEGIPIGTAGMRRIMTEARLALESGDVGGFQGIVARAAAEAARTREYSLAFGQVVRNYSNSLARPYVWSVEKIGKGFGKLPEKLTLGTAFEVETNRLPILSQKILRTDYMPMLQGQLTDQQANAAFRWANLKLKALEWLDAKGPTGKPIGLAGHIPTKWRKRIGDMLVNERGGLSYLNAQGKVAGYFYLSTLGFNPGSAIQNSFQTFITTLPMIGGKAYWRGKTEVIKRMTRSKDGYLALRMQKVTPQDALERVFPEFSKTALAPEPLSQAIMRDALEEMWQGAKSAPMPGLVPGSKNWWTAVKKAAMFMFTGTEKFNRLESFYGGRAKLLQDVGMWGKKISPAIAKEASDYGAAVVRATQFPAGPAQMPRLLMKIPAPWRQFLYFPIRYAGFLAESTLYGTAATNKRNWGTLARTMGVSAGIHRILSEAAGVDVSRSLMLGALPLPEYEQAPFYPIPIVPPLAGLAGAGAMAVFGKREPLLRALPVLVPGGVMARRAYAKLHPRFARYKERTPDGKIPVYGKNQALVGHYTPMQLFMQSIGLRPTDVTAEQGMTRYLLKHRDTIRTMRRDYVEALVTGNPEEAQRIQDAFQRMYPSLGGIRLKKSDMRAAQDRRMFTRLQRLVRTLPTEYRPQFGQLINTAAAGYMGNALGMREPAPMMAPWGAPSLQGPMGGMRTPFQGPAGAFGL